ncbi:Spo0E family sporulation regulatory protein-aspartic acid phosphatase [Aquibacillus halophilus]|uniref:Spo0E family sporulation regulatory protein-aspartic acid phosphatase n=1 Tax=Aquibacillus halophilus TaxID=930132 RepID=A0A6A8DK26_9BACI|nr:aspartyl-phosphate phosphatase Spo0E family protein [Aquibacillus halophilus]MRH43337.1 Spo0E family sporulation regulatory protein-aspartic acid phosphatase [Aquibacillus halophilus]
MENIVQLFDTIKKVVQPLGTLIDNSIELLIEDLRQEMYKAYSRDPYGPEVIELSQQLDELINIAMNKKEPTN